MYDCNRQVEEDYGGNNDERKDPDYWRVKLPSDELEILMWGGKGAPSPASSPAPKFQKSWAKREQFDQVEGQNGHNKENGALEEGDDVQQNDNISSAIDSSAPVPEATKDEVILEDIVWKQRSGFGKYSLGILKHE